MRAATFAPLRVVSFRRIWLASLVSNLGLLIQGVGAAWAMTQLTDRADQVALVQTALMLPTMLLALPAGALADMFDRRIIGLVATMLSLLGATLLTITAYAGWLTPVTILCMTLLVGSGMALFGPAWQASVSEQVPLPMLPAAVALTAISYNVARSFGPAIGGMVVAAAGAATAFLLNALFYLPLIVVLFSWRRARVTPRLPPERIDRAILSGVRYVANSPPMQRVVVRTIATGLAGGAILALMPLVARDVLHGSATTYGLMLGGFGLGAVAGGTRVSHWRERLGTEMLIRISTAACGAAMMVVASSSYLALSIVALLAAGAGWMLVMTCFNVAMQVSSPRWVAGRALASYQASVTGGIALGSIFWGTLAMHYGTAFALAVAGALMCAVTALGVWSTITDVSQGVIERESVAEPSVSLSLTGRSGPIVVELDYTVAPAAARRFYTVMLKLQQSRRRNGAYGCSLARDLSAQERWTERFHCPTWHDYLRLRDRVTAAEQVLHAEALSFMLPDAKLVVRRYLERPFGSVRWQDDTLDPGLPLSTPP